MSEDREQANGGPGVPGEARFEARLAAFLDADLTAAGLDQAGSDPDRTASDLGRAAAADAQLDAERADLIEGARERQDWASRHRRDAGERLRSAAQRDEAAHLRDLAAQARDRAAAGRDRAADARGRQVMSPLTRATAAALRALRSSAGEQRAQAADDRARAAADRVQAARDRWRAAADLRHAHLDQLTGAFGRGLGELALEHEIERAARSGRPLVLAFIDVDDLKAVNDGEGHAAGDGLLRDVVAAIRRNLRSYDVVTVRVGGDEFICALSDTTLSVARSRLDEIRETLVSGGRRRSISFGLAELRPDENLHDLIARGDAALYQSRSISAGNG